MSGGKAWAGWAVVCLAMGVNPTPARAQVGFGPVIGTAPSGVAMGVAPVASADGRYVRFGGLTPQFSTLNGFDTAVVPGAVAGGGVINGGFGVAQFGGANFGVGGFNGVAPAIPYGSVGSFNGGGYPGYGYGGYPAGYGYGSFYAAPAAPAITGNALIPLGNAIRGSAGRRSSWRYTNP